MKNHESNAQYWSIPEGAYDILDVFQGHRLCKTVEADKTTGKTLMNLYSKKYNTISRFDRKLFLQKLLGVSPCKSQDTSGTFECFKLMSITTFDKFSSQWDCLNGILANCFRFAIFFSFALIVALGHGIFERPKKKSCKKLNKKIQNMQVYLEDDYRNAVVLKIKL